MSEYRDTFEHGDRVRVAGGYDYVTPFAFGGTVGTVIGPDTGTEQWVWVRFPAGTNVDAGTNFRPHMSAVFGPHAARFHRDWLHRVVYVSVRFYGPGMQPNRSEFHGARYVVTGTRGNRRQMTVPHDDARHGWNGDANGADAAVTFARVREDMCAPVAELVRTRNGARTYAVTETGTCDCSDEYGPCEWHAETIITREGASMRSADELAHLFLSDVASACGAWPSDDYRESETRLGNALADSGGTWFDNPDDADECRDMIGTGESFLSDHGMSVWWEDGYRIVRVTGGPFA